MNNKIVSKKSKESVRETSPVKTGESKDQGDRKWWDRHCRKINKRCMDCKYELLVEGKSLEPPVRISKAISLQTLEFLEILCTLDRPEYKMWSGHLFNKCPSFEKTLRIGE